MCERTRFDFLPNFLAAILIAAMLVVSRADALESRTPLSQYSHHFWRFGDAGLLGTPQSLTQTSDGYIWIGTSNGLFRFDGVRFTRWIPPRGETFPSDSMWFVFGARNGSLYVSTDRGLTRMTAGHLYLYPGSPRWPGPFVEDAAGTIWMGVSGIHSQPSALCHVGESRLACLGSQDGFGCDRGVSNVIDDQGFIWIGGNGGTCRWRPGTTAAPGQFAPLPSEGARTFVRSLAVSSDGTVWAGTEHKLDHVGLVRFVDGRWQSYAARGIDGSQLSVSALLANRNGALWVGTSDAGVYRLADEHWEHFGTADGLTDNNILSMFADREGAVWIVTPRGIEHFGDCAVATLTSKEGVIAGHAESVTADRRGNVYLGSGSLIRLSHNVAQPVKLRDGRPIEDVRFLFTDSADNVWIAARDHLWVLGGERFPIAVRGYPDSRGRFAAYITEDSTHDVWVSMRDTNTLESSLTRIHDSIVVENHPTPAQMSGQVLNALAPNPAGGLWVGSATHGLYWFHENRFDRVAADGFDARVENLLQDRDGALWIVTQAGFVRYANGNARMLDAAAGLPCSGGVNIFDDGEGSKWFYMHCGIVKITDAQIAAWVSHPNMKVHGRLFGPLEGARPNLSNGSPARTADGRLWSAGDYDFQVIDTHHLPFNSLAPPVRIEKLSADGREFPADHEVRLPALTRQIEIDYTALSYLMAEKVQFLYRLQGHDPRWVAASNRRQAFYNDLSAGVYVFRVIASNNDGVWNTAGAQLRIIIPPAWYQMTTVRAGAVFLAVAIGIGTYLYRMQVHSEALRRRFDVRLQERTRLARELHDTLLQTIHGSKMVADDAREHVLDANLTRTSLDRLSNWLDRAGAEGRAALESLRSSSTEMNDLAGALRRVVEDNISTRHTKFAVLTSGVPANLHPIVRDEVYRIAYEAIRNAATHSNATEISVELHYGRKFRLAICDNGCGIAPQVLQMGKPGHFGLAGMRERAAAAGGMLEITSDSNGSAVRLTIPGQSAYERTPVSPFRRLLDLGRRRQPRRNDQHHL